MSQRRSVVSEITNDCATINEGPPIFEIDTQLNVMNENDDDLSQRRSVVSEITVTVRTCCLEGQT